LAKETIVAVLSGDLVKSKGLEEKRQGVMDHLRQAVEGARTHLAKKNCRLLFSGFYRGDAFQCALSDPRFSLWTAIFLRTELIKLRGKLVSADIRFGLGLGPVSVWDENNISASDGEAFRLSGKALDELKSGKEKYRRLRILSPWPEQDRVLSVLAALIDALIQGWTSAQAEAVSLYVRENGQDEISKELGISQPAVQIRLERAGHFAVKETLDIFSGMVEEHIIRPSIYNP